MNAAGRKTFRILITGILFLLLLSGGAQAEKTLTASCPSRSGEKVTARYGKDGYVLSLPGFWDLGKIRLEMEGSGTLLLGTEKREIRSGEDADLTALAGKKITVSGEQYRKMKQEKWNREMSEEERQVALLLMWEEEVADLIDR